MVSPWQVFSKDVLNRSSELTSKNKPFVLCLWMHVCVFLWGEGLDLCLFVCVWAQSQIFETSNRLQVADVTRVSAPECNDRVKKCKQWCLHGWHKSPTWNACHLPSVSHQSALHRVRWWAQALLPSVILSVSISVISCPLIGVFSSFLSFHSSLSPCFDLSVWISISAAFNPSSFWQISIAFTFISGLMVRLTETDNAVLFYKVQFFVV